MSADVDRERELREQCAGRIAGLGSIVKRLRATSDPDDLADSAFLLGALDDISTYVDYLRAREGIGAFSSVIQAAIDELLAEAQSGNIGRRHHLESALASFADIKVLVDAERIVLELLSEETREILGFAP